MSAPIQWEITRIDFPDEEDGKIAVAIKPLKEVQLHPDQRTQIAVNKKQTARTDLFGFGAIIYDMLTCGRSPEQFYDLLRTHDRSDTEIETGIAQRYLHFRNGGGTIPEIDTVFQNLRVDSSSDFPTLGIVRIVLKCMMSRPKDSYFNCEDRAQLWNAVKGDLMRLEHDISDGEDYRRIESNFLTNPDREASNDVVAQESPQTMLADIQELSYEDPRSAATRMVRGVRLVDQVARMIQRELTGGPDFQFLVDISPKSLRIHRGDFVSNYAFFEKESDFRNMISSGNPRAALQTFTAGTLRPPFMETLFQECEVWRDSSSGSTKLFFDPWGRGNWSGLIGGDRISIGISSTKTINARIRNVDGGSLELDPELGDGPGIEELRAGTRYRATRVRGFTPADYYVAMLGIYVRLVFFVDPKDRREYIPEGVFDFEHTRMERSMSVSEAVAVNACAARDSLVDTRTYEPRKRFSWGRRDGGRARQQRGDGPTRDRASASEAPMSASGDGDWQTPKMDGLFRSLASVFLQLITREVFDSSGRRQLSVPAKDGGEVVMRSMTTLNGAVAQAFGCEHNELLVGKESDVIDKLTARGYSSDDFPDIGKLTRDIVKSWSA